MKHKKLIISIVVTSILLMLLAFIYGIYIFFSAFAPQKITITTTYISTNKDFINGVTIEKLKVDSLGTQNYPVKYTVTYKTACVIIHPQNKPPTPPNKIYFTKEGKYLWYQEFVNIPYIHNGLDRQTKELQERLMVITEQNTFKTCPIALEKDQWYFFTFSDPQITGIFFYINSMGKSTQYLFASGVSPI